MPRGRTNAGGSQGNDIGFPWDHAAPMSSSINEGFDDMRRTSQQRSGRSSLVHDVADTNIRFSPTVGASRRGSVSSGQFREESPVFPEGAGEIPMDDYRLPSGLSPAY
jgi:hypothetical protein